MRVELISTDNQQEKIVFDKLPVIVGLAAAADVRLHDFWADRCQCMIDQEGDSLQVLDLGTRTGIWVNDVRVKRAELRPGDKLTVGRTALFIRYECERDEGSSAVVSAPSRAFLSRTDSRSLMEGESCHDQAEHSRCQTDRNHSCRQEVVTQS